MRIHATGLTSKVNSTEHNYPASECKSYKPGHHPHFIQVSNSSRENDYPGIPCTVVEHHENGVIVVQCGGDEKRFWTHDPVRVAWLVQANGGEVLLQERSRLLRTKADDGWFCFSLADADHWADETCAI